jgi:predicted flap endonuclease-1-like 5' DNA nuclease
MRSDYVLYIVAIIFFILTGVVAAYAIEQKDLWIVTSAVLGLAFIGLGYSQRPKTVATAPTTTIMTPSTMTVTSVAPPPPLVLTTQPTVQTIKEEKAEPAIEALSTAVRLGLTKVKGIGEKRESQLKALGINSITDLAKASAKDLAAKLQISPKITGKWIETAKGIIEKS